MPPRPSLLGAAFALGIALADACWAGVPSPWPWAFAGLAAALRWPRLPAAWLVAALCCGAAAFGLERWQPRPVPAIALDRALDVVEGPIAGPIEDRPGRRQLVVDATIGRVAVAVRGEAAVLPGDRVRVRGRLRRPRGHRSPGAVDQRRRADAGGFDLAMSAAPEAVVLVEEAATRSAWRAPARLQRWGRELLRGRRGDADGTAVLRALVLGDRGGLDAELSERFRGAGISHVLAVSGLHVAAVAFLVFGVLRWIWARGPWRERAEPHRVAAAGALAVAVFYVLATGGRPSTLRALVCVAVVLCGLLLERRARVVDALGLAAIALLAHRPGLLWDPGAQLSFAASATLALAFGGARPPARGWRRVPRAVLDLGRASLWAWAATAPIAASHFHQVAAAGLAGNLVAVPIAELVLLPLGLAGLALSAAWQAGGGTLLDLAIAVAGALARGAGILAAWLPPARTPVPGALELALWAAALAAALCAVRRAARPRRWWALAVACAIGLAGVRAWPAERATGALRITFLDVGQGDAALVELPDGGVWLVDVGGLPFVADGAADPERLGASPGARAVLPMLAARGIERLDVVALSHPHPDHYLGLRALVGVVPIDALWLARPAPEEPLPGPLRDMVAELAHQGTRIVHPMLGVHVLGGGAQVAVLAPRYEGPLASEDPVSSRNDNSLVLRFEHAGRRVLFAGDVELEGEELLAGADLRADVVKVPHHGSRTSSTAAFVAATAPRAAVISCGALNRFGFPDPGVLARWRDAGADLWRTDRHGSVTAVVDADGRLSLRSFDPR